MCRLEVLGEGTSPAPQLATDEQNRSVAVVVSCFPIVMTAVFIEPSAMGKDACGRCRKKCERQNNSYKAHEFSSDFATGSMHDKTRKSMETLAESLSSQNW